MKFIIMHYENERHVTLLHMTICEQIIWYIITIISYFFSHII